MHYSTKAQSTTLAVKLLGGVAAGAIFAGFSLSTSANANDADQHAIALTTVSNASTANAAIPIDEVNRYFLRMMTQIFDGAEDFSHTQVASFARMRKNNESLTLLDFGDGAVVISDPSGLSAGGFANVSGTELGLVYHYDTKSIGGTSPLARFHNEFVRPQLDRAPGLGADANWATTIPATALGIAGLTGAGVEMDLSRQYFIYDGKPMVLVEYLIPAISYNTPGGTDVIHWGRGFALSDPGFGMIYANVALHRSTASEPDGSLRPYRFYRASFASDDNGKPMIDIVKIPQVAKIYDDYFGKQALEVIPYSDVGLNVDQTPIKFAANLDIMAMAIGENGANDNSVLAAAQTGANRGAETAKPTPEQYRFEGRPPTEGAKKMPDGGLVYQGPRTKEEMAKAGAKAYTVGSQPGAESGLSDPALVPHEKVFQSTSAKRDPKAPYPAEATTQDEGAAKAIEGKVLELAPPGSRGGGGGGSGGGGGEGSKSGKGSGGGGGSGKKGGSNQLDQAVELGTNVNTSVSAIDKTVTISSTLLLTDGKNLVAQAEEIHAISMNLANSVLSNKRSLDNASGNYSIAVKQKADAIRHNPNLSAADYAALNQRVESAGSVLQQVEREVNASNRGLKSSLNILENQAKGLSELIAKTPLPKLSAYMEQFGKSPAGKIIGAVSHGLNTATTVTAVSNAANASVTDMSSGDLALTRTYGANFGSLSALGLDLVAIAGNLSAGNVVGAVSDGVAVITGSLSDIYISAKAVQDTHELNMQLSNEYIANLKKLTAKTKVLEAEKLADLKADPTGLYTGEDPYKDGYDLKSPGYDEATGAISETRKQYLIKHNRGEAIRLGLIKPDAPEGNKPATPAKFVTKPKPVDPGPTRAELLKGLAKEIDKQDYPTARPGANDKRPVKAKPVPASITTNPVQQAELDRQARKAQAQTDLDAYQAKRRAERKAEEEAQSARPRGGPLTTSTLTTSDFGTKPVSFNPVKFDPVTFDDDQDLFVRNEDGTTSLKKVGPDDFVLPEFIPPTFQGPKSTEIEWTNFDDDDYPGGDSVPAFGYETMSGKIATDLAPWEEWLATQDIRKLERLARQAGYPNLASMLTDAANIIRQSQDKGYRKWALTAPACGGLIGCGPSYLERWAMKRSILALGDILNQSRDVFSTGGLSDIAISNERLTYILRDFGLEDGDIVDILIQQFGRTAFSGRLTLRNAGDVFNILLRRGVAQLTITAVNEGFASPNTAEINVENVTRGDSRQTYSLRTGQSATLRIETNKPAPGK